MGCWCGKVDDVRTILMEFLDSVSTTYHVETETLDRYTKRIEDAVRASDLKRILGESDG